MRASVAELDRALGVARRAAAQAGELLREGRRRGFTVEHKGAVDLVTEYDRRSEALVVETLRREFPDHTIIAEEGGAVQRGERGEHGEDDERGEDDEDDDRGERVWLVDPLDGTTNFAHGVPFYAVSIALELGGEPAVGVVHLPELGWEFAARRGSGARWNDEPIHVSSTPRLEVSLLATGFPYDRRTSPDNNLRQFGALMPRTQGVRRVGVASLDCALVAWGVYDGYWEYKLKPWDIAAGALLVLEAGGRLTDARGGPYRSGAGNLVATNGLIHQELLEALAAAGG